MAVKLYPPLFIMLLWACAAAVWAVDAQQRQQDLQRDIRQLSRGLEAQKLESGALQDEVAKLEKKLGAISAKHYQTEKKIEAILDKLRSASVKKAKLENELAAQKARLARQLRASYSAGEQSHLRLLLKQDKPADISRTMRYFGYLGKSRLARIKSVEKTLAEINQVYAGIEKERIALQSLTKTLGQQKAEIEAALKARETLLRDLKGDIRSKEKQLGKLKTDEAGLQTMLDKLADKTAKRAGTGKVISTEVAAKNAAVPDTSKQVGKPEAAKPVITAQPFASLRGKLPWPVAGKIIHSYGSQRNEKQAWKGVVIAAPGGDKVKAVAKGRVAFAGWMDGYGHLIIVEHDGGYMSLYGYNRAVYKREGETVSAGETIAAVGNSSGQSRDALYFEIRQGAAPQNPARWLR